MGDLDVDGDASDVEIDDEAGSGIPEYEEPLVPAERLVAALRKRFGGWRWRPPEIAPLVICIAVSVLIVADVVAGVGSGFVQGALGVGARDELALATQWAINPFIGIALLVSAFLSWREASSWADEIVLYGATDGVLAGELDPDEAVARLTRSRSLVSIAALLAVITGATAIVSVVNFLSETVASTYLWQYYPSEAGTCLAIAVLCLGSVMIALSVHRLCRGVLALGDDEPAGADGPAEPQASESTVTSPGA